MPMCEKNIQISEVLIERAIELFIERDFNSSLKKCKAAIKCDDNNWRTYFFIILNYFELGYYNGLDDYAKLLAKKFEDIIEVQWLYSRILILFSKSELAIKVLEKEVQKQSTPLIESEIIYLHLTQGDTEKAFDKIDSYLTLNIDKPDLEEFKMLSVNNIIAYVKTIFKTQGDSDSLEFLIIDKKSYKKILKLCKKANSLAQTELTENLLNYTKSFGKFEFKFRHKKELALITLSFLFFSYLGGFQLKSFYIYLIISVAVLATGFNRRYCNIKESYTNLEPDYCGLILQLGRLSPVIESSDFLNSILGKD